MPSKKTPVRSTRAKSSKPKSISRKSQKAQVAALNAGPRKRENSKLANVIAMLRKPEGATIDEMMKATGWQRHSVRGAMSGAIKKKLGLDVTSEVTDDARRYRISAEA